MLAELFPFFLPYPAHPQEAPLHLLGRNHPLVKQAEKIPFKQPDFEDPFSIYYNSEDLAADDYLLYNYDYVDEQDSKHGLPIKGDYKEK